MSEQTAKPYLLRAIYEWCSDQGFTPFLAVKVNSATRVPQAFVKNGEIVLNVSATATRHLTIDNDWVQFSARFNGSSQEVSVPMGAVAGIFARETGYGFTFAIQPDAPVTAMPANGPAAVPVAAGAGPAAAEMSTTSAGDEAAHSDPDPGDKPRGRPNLQVVK